MTQRIGVENDIKDLELQIKIVENPNEWKILETIYI